MSAHDAAVALGERDGFVCHYCHVELVDVRRNDAWNTLQAAPWPTVDHVIPRRDGGTDDLDNLVLACGSCNARKGARPYADFVA